MITITTAIAAATVVLGLAGPVSAQAAPIRDCGTLPDLLNGYEQIVNITSRNVPCPPARWRWRAARRLATVWQEEFCRSPRIYFR
jgi:hypothetical protein